MRASLFNSPSTSLYSQSPRRGAPRGPPFIERLQGCLAHELLLQGVFYIHQQLCLPAVIRKNLFQPLCLLVENYLLGVRSGLYNVELLRAMANECA